MSEVAAPIAAPAAQATETKPAAAPAKVEKLDKAPAKPAAEAAPSWSEKDDAELLERLKRSPYAKIKVNGKEEGIESLEDLKRRNLDAMRGRGANRLVEETKKEAEEAKAAKSRLEQYEKLLGAARKGDMRAIRQLGLLQDAERQQQEEALSKLPPEVRAIVEENQTLAQRVREAEEAKLADQRKAEQMAAQKAREEVLAKARSYIPELMSEVREEFADVDLPDVLRVLEDLREEGARLGVDYDVSHVKLMVKRLRENGVDMRMQQLQPAAALKRLGPVMAKMKSEELASALGEQFEPIARAMSAAYVSHVKRVKRVKATPPAVHGAKPAQAAAASPPKQPLSPFRFRG